MRWQCHILLVLATNIIMGNGFNVGNKLFIPDFFKILFSLKGQEGVVFRQKYMRELPRPGVTINLHQLIDCPGRLLNVMEALSCKNTTNGIAIQLKVLQFLYATEVDHQLFESLFQRNCTMLSDQYAHTCQLILAGNIISIDIFGVKSGINKCYEEYKRATDINMSRR